MKSSLTILKSFIKKVAKDEYGINVKVKLENLNPNDFGNCDYKNNIITLNKRFPQPFELENLRELSLHEVTHLTNKSREGSIGILEALRLEKKYKDKCKNPEDHPSVFWREFERLMEKYPLIDFMIYIQKEYNNL